MISLKEKNTDFNSLKTFVSEIEVGGFLIDYYPIMRNYHLVSKLDLPLSLNYEDDFLEEHINFSAVNLVVKKSNPNKVCILFLTEVSEISYGEMTKKENIKLALNNSAKTNYVIFIRDGLLVNYFDSIDNNFKRFNNKQFKKVFINETFQVY